MGYWFENEGRYVSATGTPLEPPPADADRNKVTIERAHQPIAAIWHRRGHRADCDQERADREPSGRARQRAPASRRHGQPARASASRARLVAVQEEQRRQVERDLHDGLQQRLLAIVFDLRLAKVAADRNAASRRSEWLAEAEALALLMVDEVRRLARGIYPAILSQAGLAAALSSLADEAPIPSQSP